MINEYIFQYNLPVDNSISDRPDTLITVRATELVTGIALEFPMLPASTIYAVKDWEAAIKDMKRLAGLNFEARQLIGIIKDVYGSKINTQTAA